jgi:hypothetical protein
MLKNYSKINGKTVASSYFCGTKDGEDWLEITFTDESILKVTGVSGELFPSAEMGVDVELINTNKPE